MEDRSKQLNVRVPTALAAQVKRAARDAGESEATIVRVLLRHGLEQQLAVRVLLGATLVETR